MKKTKILDQNWQKQIRKINKILLTIEKDPSPELVVDHNNKTLEIHTKRFSHIDKKKRGIHKKVKKKFAELEKLQKKIEKHEKVKLIRNYYINLINDLKLNLHLYKAKTSSSYTESERNHKTSEIYSSLYPIPHVSHREVFINEFIDFLKFLKVKELFEVDKLSFIEEICSYDFYNITQREIEADFDKITDAYVQFTKNSALEREKSYSAKTIKKVFKAFLGKISISQDIKVKIKNKYLFAVDSSNVYIPAKANHNKIRITKLIAHEILVHAYRSILGNKNRNANKEKLFLLKIGNSLNTPIEEGLGSYFEQNIFYQSAKYDIYSLFNFYLRTIAVHLALDHEPYQVYEKLDKLCSVYTQIFNLSEKSKNITRDILLLRIYRGFKKPEKGCVNGRVAQYLLGNRMIWEFVENGGNLFNLFAGKIQINQIEEFRKLGFNIPEEFLGHKEFPREYILKLVDECFQIN
jgi:hypothetical protein